MGVTVVGCPVFAQRITAPDGRLDWRRGDCNALLHAPIAVPASIEAASHGQLSAFGLVFGCFEFALTGDGDTAEDRGVVACNPDGPWG